MKKQTTEGKGIKDRLEFKVKEDKFGNLIIHFVKDMEFKKGDNIFIYEPFKENGVKIETSFMEVYVKATELSMRRNQIVGEKRDYYITLAQLESILMFLK